MIHRQIQYDKDGNNNYNNFNLNEEDKYIINNKLSKQEEEDKEILQKIIECFNPSSDNITLNTSFEESSFKKDENNIEYKLLNESNYI